jgi:hypothetical protein
LYFTDADTVHHSSALASLLRDAELERLDLLSGWPALLPRSPAIAAVDILCAGVLASWYRPRQGAGAAPRPAFANGQALLIRAATLARIGGHEAVRSRLLEDVAIAEAVEAHGGRSGVVLLRDLVAVHSYPSVSMSIRSWSRILREGAHRRTRRLLKPAIALPLAAWSGWGAFLAGCASGSAPALLAGLTAIAISTIAVGLAHADARAPRWPALLLPFAAIAAALALLRAARVGATNSDVEWHGVTYPDRATDAPR